MVGWGLTWLALPVSLPSLSLLLLLLGYPHAGARQCPGVGTTQGMAVGRPRLVGCEDCDQGGGRMPQWCRWAGVVWAQRNNDIIIAVVIAIISVAQVRNRRGWDWAAPEVQVWMCGAACDRGVGMGNGVAWGGGLGWLSLGWVWGVGWLGLGAQWGDGDGVAA
jgi:hypothetical protein